MCIASASASCTLSGARTSVMSKSATKGFNLGKHPKGPKYLYGTKYGFCSSNFPYGLGKDSPYGYLGPFRAVGPANSDKLIGYQSVDKGFDVEVGTPVSLMVCVRYKTGIGIPNLPQRLRRNLDGIAKRSGSQISCIITQQNFISTTAA